MKNLLRKEIATMTGQLSDEYTRTADEGVLENVLSLEEYRSAKVLFCFVSVVGEPDTYRIISDALTTGKIVGVPLCTGKGIMEIRQITSLADLVPGFYSIPEPKRSCPVIPKEGIDLALIPCVTCNTQGQRLGHGGGFYDRFLEPVSDQRTFASALICYEKVLYENIPMEEHDQTVEMVITEKKVYRP